MEVLSPRLDARRKPLFVTFYSFKGGVGRTMALLNVASMLAGLGQKVLMVDFDLEAPGLTLFQDRGFEADSDDALRPSQMQEGMVDMLVEFVETPEEATVLKDDRSLFFDRFVADLGVPDSFLKRDDGRLDLIPAGRLTDEYERRMHGLEFKEMFEEGVGKPLFDEFKAVLKDGRDYDYVFIDSRTGFSDEGSISTRFLPDYVIVLTGLNRQNVRGTTRFIERMNLGDRGRQVAFVASPVPTHYEDVRKRRIETAQQQFEAAGISRARFIAELPYHPLLALDEDPREHDLSASGLHVEYRKIVERIRSWASDLPEARMDEAMDALFQGKSNEALDIIKEVGAEDPELVLQTLSGAASSLVREVPDGAKQVMHHAESLAADDRLLRMARSLLTRTGRGFQEHGLLEDAIELHTEALKMSRKMGDPRFELTDSFGLGVMYHMSADGDRALNYYQEAINIARDIEDKQSEAIALSNLGNVFYDLGDPDSALDYYEEAFDIAREIGELSSQGVAIANLATVEAERGRSERAESYLEDGRDIFQKLSQPALTASFYVEVAEARSHYAPDDALATLDEHWTLVTEHANTVDRMRAHVLRARLRLEVDDDREGAAEDARTAAEFYRERGADSRWSREAEDILEKLDA